jgi:hypothetical protein
MKRHLRPQNRLHRTDPERNPDRNVTAIASVLRHTDIKSYHPEHMLPDMAGACQAEVWRRLKRPISYAWTLNDLARGPARPARPIPA